MRVTIRPVGSAILAMLLTGIISLAVSVGYDSSVLAFIGLGLVFWGAIFLYIRPEEYVRKALAEAALAPSLTTLNQMIQDLGYKGDTTYLPPKYFANPDTTKMYISRYKYASLPTPELIQQYENQIVAETTQGLLTTPPGIRLSELMEKSLGTTFIKTSLEELEQKLPKVVIEDLEVAENLEIARARYIEGGNITIYAKITKPIYRSMSKDAEEPSQTTNIIGDPVCSAIAIALAKASGKPVRITNAQSSEDGNTLEATYMLIED